ncbi:MAG: RsmG family class I SAM-dependent methyltransferase [bacterium]
MKQYFEKLKKYNRTHRLIGNVSCETLVSEATKAIRNSEDLIKGFTTMVDVGSGSGVLAYAWLKSSPDRRVVALEPDRKALAFLLDAFAEESRAIVVGDRIENFKEQRVLDFCPDKSKLFFAARAFSSTESLEVLYLRSKLKFPLFIFDKSEDRYSLIKKF